MPMSAAEHFLSNGETGNSSNIPEGKKTPYLLGLFHINITLIYKIQTKN